jgi:hypothetical protein
MLKLAGVLKKPEIIILVVLAMFLSVTGFPVLR